MKSLKNNILKMGDDKKSLIQSTSQKTLSPPDQLIGVNFKKIEITQTPELVDFLTKSKSISGLYKCYIQAAANFNKQYLPHWSDDTTFGCYQFIENKDTSYIIVKSINYIVSTDIKVSKLLFEDGFIISAFVPEGQCQDYQNNLSFLIDLKLQQSVDNIYIDKIRYKRKSMVANAKNTDDFIDFKKDIDFPL